MKRVLFVVVASVAALMVGAAGAYFTAQAQVPDNVVRAGSFSISTEPSSAAVCIDTLAPGVAVTRTLTLVNEGVLPASVVVTAAKKAGITEFYAALTCRATCEGAVLYDGPLSGLRTTAVTLPPAGRVPMDFAVSLPATSGNELSEDYAKFTLYADAEQVR